MCCPWISASSSSPTVRPSPLADPQTVGERGEMLFVDRADAGQQLARRLLPLRGADAVVVALPRGGVPVAAEVARELRAPLDVIVVRKLGVPFQPECGFGAIGEGGATVIDDRVVHQASLTRQAIAGAEARERARLDRRLAQLLSRANVFNVALLAARLAVITRWLRDQPGIAAVPVGYFGASTGTAAALAAATATPRPPVTAIVSRGGRPDLVGGRLALVQALTLLIVGGADKVVLDLNQRAHTQLKCESRLAVVPGATHLFSEPGALGQVTDLAVGWFGRHFAWAGAIPAAA